MNLPSESQVRRLVMIDTPRMAELLGISTHALHMRVRRGSISAPHHHFKGGCLMWIATRELLSELHLRVEDL